MTKRGITQSEQGIYEDILYKIFFLQINSLYKSWIFRQHFRHHFG